MTMSRSELPPIVIVVELLCTPSAVTISVLAPAPLNSAGTKHVNLIESRKTAPRHCFDFYRLSVDCGGDVLRVRNASRKDRKSQLTVRRIKRSGCLRVGVENDRFAFAVTFDSKHARRRC